MPHEQSYDSEFYDEIGPWSTHAAYHVVPVLIEWLHPRSVADIGCGDGSFLATFVEHGVDDVFGVDGEHVPKELLRIPAERFLAHDLTMPLHLDRRFDLVLSTEVAEHLPGTSAATFVHDLCALGDVVVFSAA